jgi:hypothetical protein
MLLTTTAAVLIAAQVLRRYGRREGQPDSAVAALGRLDI